MKGLKSIVILIMIVAFNQLTAQDIKEMVLPMSDGDKNALVLTLPKTDAKEVEKTWLKFLKDYDGKTKKNKKTSEIFTDNASIETMSKNTVDIYTLVKSKNDGSELTVWFDLGGAYLNSTMHVAQYEVAKDLLNSYAKTISVTMAEEVLKTETDALAKAEDALEKLDKSEADMKKSIAEYQAKIKELETEIEKNNETRKTQIKVVEEQRTKTEAAEKALKAVKN